MAFSCLALAAGLSASVVWQAGRSTITPYVIEVESLGAVRAVGPLGKAARAHIDALPGKRNPDAFLFPRYAEGRGTYSLTECWRAVYGDAKLRKLRLHDLRHTAASHAVMSGENLPLVGKLLGHRRHATTAGYAHLADGHLVDAVERVRKVIEGRCWDDVWGPSQARFREAIF